VIRNETTEVVLQAEPIDPFLMRMLDRGGIIPLAAELAGEL